MSTRTMKGVACWVGLLAVAATASADVVELQGGDRISGKVLRVHGGKVVVATAYAGEVTIDQAVVTRLATDEPVLVRAGTNLHETAEGVLVYDATTGVVLRGDTNTPPQRVAGETVVTAFRPGDVDPDIPPPPKRWAFSAALNLTGKSGNTESFYGGFLVDAIYNVPSDTFKLYGRSDYESVEGEMTAQLINFGADYEHRMPRYHGFYVREDVLQNKPQNLQWRSFTAGGYSLYLWREMDAKNTVSDVLRLRAGLGYAHEEYVDDEKENNANIDGGLWFRKALWTKCAWNTEITIEPSVDDFADVYGRHESRLELGLFTPTLKQELGIANEYQSMPGDGAEKLDTLWFVRLRGIW